MTFLFFMISLALKKGNPDKRARVYKGANEITNLSPSPSIEAILFTGLNSLGIDSVSITVVDISNNLDFSDEDIFTATQAFIVNPSKNRYTIFFNSKNDKDATLLIMSHELIHLKQFHEERLEILGGGLAIFEGDTIKASRTFYLDRGWEIEAYGKQRILSDEIKEKI